MFRVLAPSPADSLHPALHKMSDHHEIVS